MPRQERNAQNTMYYTRGRVASVGFGQKTQKEVTGLLGLSGLVSWDSTGNDRLKLLVLNENSAKITNMLLGARVDGSLVAWNVLEGKQLFITDGGFPKTDDDLEPKQAREIPGLQPNTKAADFVVKYFGDKLMKQGGQEVSTVDALMDKTHLALYFGGSWCPYCPPFSHQLKAFYEQYKVADPKLEVIFVSSDRDADSAKEYFAEHQGDWLMMPFDGEKQASLSEMCEVRRIPSFATLTVEGTVLNTEARGVVYRKTRRLSLRKACC